MPTLTRPLLIGRGPWAQRLHAALPHGTAPTISGAVSAVECIREARKRGNDCVIVASRTDSHYALLMEALKRELPVFCEKPMVLSVLEAETVAHAWADHGHPTFVCDFVHLWSHGFEYAWQRYAAKGGFVNVRGKHVQTPKFSATLRGEWRRADVHPVWDYGSHVIAMALMLGIDLRDLQLSEGYGDQWFIENEHCSILVDVNKNTKKKFDVHFSGIFDYVDNVWIFKHAPAGSDIFDNLADPPLQRALKVFLSGSDRHTGRAGMDLPLRVTRVLKSICSSDSPFK